MLAGGMNEGGLRFLRSLRAVVWMLTENGDLAERLFSLPVRCQPIRGGGEFARRRVTRNPEKSSGIGRS